MQSSDIRYRGAHPQQDLIQLVKIISFYSALVVAFSDSMVQWRFKGVLLHKTGMMKFIQCQKNTTQMQIAVTCLRTEKFIESNYKSKSLLTYITHQIDRFHVKHIVVVFSTALGVQPELTPGLTSLQAWD